MIKHLASRDGDIPARRPYDKERRSGTPRRQSPPFHLPVDRRHRAERRKDADWRFAVIRQRMTELRNLSPSS